MTETRQPIPHRLRNISKDHPYVAGAIDIVDDVDGRSQQEINADTYRKGETYSKEQLNNMITTPEQEYLSVTATAETTSVDDIAALIAAKYPDGKESADTVYRVGCWDGEQYDTGVYTEYVWDGTQYIPVGVKNPGIDEEPTADSDNLVKSGGVYSALLPVAESLSDYDDATPVAVTDGKIMLADGTELSIPSGEYYQYQVVAGEKYRIKSRQSSGWSSVRLYILEDSEGNVIDYGPVKTPGVVEDFDEAVVIPDDVTKMYVNNDKRQSLYYSVNKYVGYIDVGEIKDGNKPNGIMKVVINNFKAGFYIRTAYNDTKDIIITHKVNSNGLMTFDSTYIGSRGLSDTEIMDSANNVSAHNDSTSPIRNYTQYWHLFGQHGYPVPYIANPGMTSADIGASWKDQLDRYYTVGKVTESYIWLLPVIYQDANGHYTRDWQSLATSAAITGLTYVSGGTYTSDITVGTVNQEQLQPIMEVVDRKWVVDGKEAGEAGIYYCDEFSVSETELGYDPATIHNWFSTNDKPSLTGAKVQAVFTCSYNYKGAQCSVNTTFHLLREARGKYSATQQQFFVDNGDYKAMFMIPKAATKGGVDYSKPFNSPSMSGSNVYFYRNNQDLLDVDELIDRQIGFLYDPNADKYLVGMAAGLSLVSGDTVKAKRNQMLPSGKEVMHLSPSNINKFYVQSADSSVFKSGYFPAGYFKEINYYVSYFDPAQNVGQVYWYKDGNCYVIYAHCQSKQSALAINVPPFMDGLALEILEKTENTDLLTDTIANGKFFVNYNTADANYIVLKTDGETSSYVKDNTVEETEISLTDNEVAGYIADRNKHVIAKIMKDGSVKWLVDNTVEETRLSLSDGNVAGYVTDRNKIVIAKLMKNGAVEWLVENSRDAELRNLIEYCVHYADFESTGYVNHITDSRGHAVMSVTDNGEVEIHGGGGFLGERSTESRTGEYVKIITGNNGVAVAGIKHDGTVHIFKGEIDNLDNDNGSVSATTLARAIPMIAAGLDNMEISKDRRVVNLLVSANSEHPVDIEGVNIKSKLAPCISIIDDDTVDLQIPSSRAEVSPVSNRGGYFSVLLPFMLSLGAKHNKGIIPVGLACEGHRVGLTTYLQDNDNYTSLNENGNCVKWLHDNLGWNVFNHSMTAQLPMSNTFYVNGIDSELADQILSDPGAAYVGPLSFHNTIVLDRLTGKWYEVNSTKTAWVERTPTKKYAIPFYQDYVTRKWYFNRNFDFEYSWGEWNRRADALGLPYEKVIVHNGDTSSLYTASKGRTYANWSVRTQGVYNYPPIPATVSRVSDIKATSSNVRNADYENTLKGYVDETKTSHSWMVFMSHFNESPHHLNYYVDGVDYPDGDDNYPAEWIVPLNHDEIVDMINGDENYLVSPPARLGISTWDEWHPAPGTQLKSLYDVLDYAMSQGVDIVAPMAGWATHGNMLNIGVDRNGQTYPYDSASSQTPYTDEEQSYLTIGADGSIRYFSK